MEEDTNMIDVNLYPKTFALMFLGLGLTAIISLVLYNSGTAYELAIGTGFDIILILELVVVIAFSFLLRKVSPMVATALFFIYAALNGVTLSVIYYLYEMQSIVSILGIAAGLFGIFAFLGYNSKIDLTKLGTICIGVLIAGIIASIVNLFLNNTMLDLILSWLILIIFFGITAYDMQKIKNMGQQGIHGDKLYIYGALELYLDFINIFLRLLRIFGKRK